MRGRAADKRLTTYRNWPDRHQNTDMSCRHHQSCQRVGAAAAYDPHFAGICTSQPSFLLLRLRLKDVSLVRTFLQSRGTRPPLWRGRYRHADPTHAGSLPALGSRLAQPQGEARRQEGGEGSLQARSRLVRSLIAAAPLLRRQFPRKTQEPRTALAGSYCCATALEGRSTRSAWPQSHAALSRRFRCLQREFNR